MKKLEVKNISFSYGDTEIISDVTLHMHEGELVSLLGVSGSGKTTLFSIIAGLIFPDRGEVYLDGIDITGKAGRVSYMLQKDLLLPYMTIEDNVSLPLRMNHIKKELAREIVKKELLHFGLAGYEKKYPAQLSGGMRQRAALLRTYMFSKNVSLLDEPFSALDALSKENMHTWYLDMIANMQMSTLFITHDIDEAILLSDRIYILSGKPGKITQEIILEDRKKRGKDFVLSEIFLSYKREIHTYLKTID